MSISPSPMMIVNRSKQTLDRARLPAARRTANVTLSNDRQTFEGEPFSPSIETVAPVSLMASRDTDSVPRDDARVSLFDHRASFSRHLDARSGFDASRWLKTNAVTIHDASVHDSDVSGSFERAADNHPEVALSRLRFAICTAIASIRHPRSSN